MLSIPETLGRTKIAERTWFDHWLLATTNRTWFQGKQKLGKWEKDIRVLDKVTETSNN